MVEDDFSIVVEKKNRLNQKKYQLLLAGLIVLIVVIVAGYFFWQQSQPAVRVDGKSITKSQLNDLSTKTQKFYQYNKDSNDANKANQIAKQKLVENTIIETEAAKRNITASDSEINQQYQAIVQKYGSEAAYAKTILADYDWTPAMTKQTIKDEILQEKLEKYVLTGYDLSYVFVRYDMGSGDGTSTSIDPTALPKAQQVAAEINDSNFDQIGQQLENGSPVTGFGQFTDVNASNEKTTFMGRTTEWQAIQSLKKVGDISPIITSGGGFYIIFKADDIYSGTYNSWDQYVNSFKVISNNTTMSELSQQVASLLKINSAYAGTWSDNGATDPVCTYNGDEVSYLPSTVHITVKDDSTGYVIPGASVSLLAPNPEPGGASCYFDECTTKTKNADGSYTCTAGTDTELYPISDIRNVSGTTDSSGVLAATNCSSLIKTKYYNSNNCVDCHLSYNDNTISKSGYETCSRSGSTVTPSGCMPMPGIANGIDYAFTAHLDPVVNGACGASINTCSAGSPINEHDNACSDTWSCQGLNTGTTADCSIPKSPSNGANGTCGSTVNNCTSGTFQSLATTTLFNWNCLGIAGTCGGTTGSNAACSSGITCTFSPTSGTLPLITKLQVSAVGGAIGPYTYSVKYLNDGSTYASGSISNSLNLSLSKVGNYMAYVTYSGLQSTCTSEITVGNPSSATGGEVSP